MGELEWAASEFENARARLFGIAYRMLGSVADAEDVVQETWIRWQGAHSGEIREPVAFLTTITTRLSINALTSARVRRETYIGPWLPEPVSTEADPALGAEKAEALQYAVLMLLERLSPAERAAYVLREAFDYPYARIAEILQGSPAAARQLVSRARKHVAGERRTSAGPSAQRRLLEAFLVAARAGDTAALEGLFAAEVVSRSDGNGARFAARRPMIGRSRVAAFVAAFSGHFWAGKAVDWVMVNGQPGVTLGENGAITALLTLSASEAGIEQLMWVMNPDKLGHVAPAD
ncbi:RNA polymerase sigma-70 factor [Pseudactinotalea sp.]|uniref:RNA polymerase sigma-70 factor n=1 Tax=Pseudactinotalea sp. TaxID=1926260 RepID=UPI003B3A8123